MTDFDNRDLNGQAPQPEQPAAQPTMPLSPEQLNEQPGRPTPNLTLEPEPQTPDIPVQETNTTSTQAFHMPEPPRAPEPPHEEPQYSAPQYGAQQPQQQNYQPNYYQQPQAQYNKPLYNTPPAGYVQKSRIAAGLLAILFGTFGVHNFYLGFNSRATIQLVVSLAGGLFTCGVATIAMAIWGLVEGILILSANSPNRMYDGNGVILRD